MKRGMVVPILVVLFSGLAGGWLLQEGVDRTENVYVRVRVLQEVIDRVGSSFVEEIDQGDLYDSAIDGLIRDLGDPHSSFVPASQYEDLRIRTEGEYGGVGLEVVHRNGYVTVVSPMQGGPGGRVGIRAGDQFYEIEGVAADTMSTDQAVDILRGRPGTSVTVKMLRPGIEEPIEFTVERAVITLRSVPFALMLEDDIGYVPFVQVRESSTEEIRSAIDSLRNEGMRGLIFDLRGNPGGLLDQGIGVSDLFIADGEDIVETRGRAANQNDTYRASSPDRYPELPIVAIVDGTSVSAAEIIAGALQDHDRAILVGETTYGKGSVQSLYPLTGGDVLRLTTAKWYTPVGRSIHAEPTETELVDVVPTLSIAGQMVHPPRIEGRPEFQSAGGRTLYGGGGITPDVYVAPAVLAADEVAAVQGLFGRGSRFWTALFDYAVAYVRDTPELQPGFRLSDAEMTAFFTSLSDFDAEIERDAFDRAERYVRFHLEGEIAAQAWGDVGRFEHRRAGDPQVGRAMELLRESRSQTDLVAVIESLEPAPEPN